MAKNKIKNQPGESPSDAFALRPPPQGPACLRKDVALPAADGSYYNGLMSVTHVGFYPLKEMYEGRLRDFYWELCAEQYGYALKSYHELQRNGGLSPKNALFHKLGGAIAHEGTGQYAQAAQLLKETLPAARDDPSLHGRMLLHMGFLQLLLKNEALARKFYGEAEKLIGEEDQAFLLYFLAQLLLKRQDKETAQKALREASAARPPLLLELKCTQALLGVSEEDERQALAFKAVKASRRFIEQTLPNLDHARIVSTITQCLQLILRWEPRRGALAETLDSYLSFARRLIDYSLFSAALPMLQRLLDLAEIYSASFPRELVAIYLLRGQALEQKKQHEKAAKDYGYALSLVTSLKSRDLLTEALTRSAVNDYKQGWKREAYERLLEAEGHAARAEDPEVLETFFRERAFVEMQLGKLEQAKAFIAKAESVARDYPIKKARSLMVRGQIHMAEGSFSQATEVLRQALGLFELNFAFLEGARCRRLLAENALAVGDLDNADFFLDEGIALLEHYEFFEELPLHYSAKANLCLLRDDVEQARTLGEKELELTRGANVPHSLAYTYFLLGRINRLQNEFSTAASLLQKAEQIFAKKRDQRMRGLCLVEQALVFSAQKDHHQALSLCQLSREYFENEGWKEGLARLYMVKGHVLRELRKVAEARQALLTAVRIQEQSIRSQNMDLSECYAELAMVALAMGNREEAADRLLAAVDIAEKLGLEQRATRYIELLQEVHPEKIAQWRLRKIAGPIFSRDLKLASASVMLKKGFVAALFVDLRGFTPMMESVEEKEVVELLNGFYTCCAQTATQHQGQLNKFLGDAALILFVKEKNSEDFESQVLRCAFTLRSKLGQLNYRRQRQHLIPFHFGMGLDWGEAFVGSFGYGVRQDFTAIGNCVNIASRLQGQAKEGEILVTESLYRQVQDRVEAEPLGERTLKGLEEPVTIFRLLGLSR